MKNLNTNNKYYTPKQLKLLLDLERLIEISAPVYSFSEIVDFMPYITLCDNMLNIPSKYSPTNH